MELGECDIAFQKFVDDLLSAKSFDPKSYCTSIGPNDEMFFKGILPGYQGNVNLSMFKYIESALRTFDIYGQFIDFLGGAAVVAPVLDFGSGWGRLTRSLVHRLPASKIWVSDIYPEAVAWQASTFGVHGLVSVSDPDRFALEQKHSIVFVGSVFSHLPSALFQRWLRKLYRLVAPHGLLAFSVHAETILPSGEELGPDGTRYLSWSESGSLQPEIYGMMYVAERYVAKCIAEYDPARKVLYRRVQKALYENQDLYVVAGEDIDLCGLDLVITPIGGVQAVARDGDMTRYSGWGIDFNEGHQLIRAELFSERKRLDMVGLEAGCEEVARYFPAAPNDPVAWTFRVPDDLGSTGYLRINLVSTTGAVARCYAAPPAPDLAKIART